MFSNKGAHLVLLLLVLAFTARLVLAAPNQTLTDARAVQIPGNLPWYPLVFFGDNRPMDYLSDYPPDVFYAAINEINMIYPIAAIGLGDHVGYGYESQYKAFYDIMLSTRLENLWFIMGNHEVVHPDGWKYWPQYIGPLYAVHDDIPGWRIALLNSEVDVKQWNQMLNASYTGLGGRKLLLVLHRPLLPEVNHNLQEDKSAILKAYMARYSATPLVVQAHWHGWAYYRCNATDWIIAGSTGAPLYPASDCQSGATCVSQYHYLYVILYPNGTYSFAPVSVTNGTLKVRTINETAYLVENHKLDVYGRPVSIPLRLKYLVGQTTIYAVLIAPPNSTIILNINPSQGNKLYTNTTTIYLYYTGSQPKATVITNTAATLTSYGLNGPVRAILDLKEIQPPPKPQQPPPQSQQQKPQPPQNTTQTTTPPAQPQQ
ncbi:MAG: metallophosphoesterase family protein, partial [Infirmifilum sp.]